MLTTLNYLKYNNFCKKIIEILNKTKLIFEKEIRENTKAFIYNSSVTIEDLLTYRFSYIEK